jgi:lipid II isoglutaminyl synthase (glutamine-hydrolysing)
MRDFAGTLIGKLVKRLLVFRPGGGQALPGLVVERLFPGYVGSMLGKLPEGVIIITGTNGKTTTTKIVTHILSSNGKRVLTNSTGSNLVRGIASSVSQHATPSGKLPYDLAVLEIDEATARRLVKQVKPRWILALNVSRDQLDRYGEVDTVAAYVGVAMEAAESIVTNAGDPHLAARAEKISQAKNTPVHYFGAAEKLAGFFPSDYELAAIGGKTANKIKRQEAEVELADFRGQDVIYKIEGKKYSAKLKLSGQHNYLNGAAALALCRRLLTDTTDQELVSMLAGVTLAFGRGEKYKLKNGAVIELVLVKNPASFTQALASYGSGRESVMIAINDNIADGRDVSWLWDVNFSPLGGRKVALTSGRRAADMALRLSYDDIEVGAIEPVLSAGMELLSQKDGPKVILATYTAMLSLYSLLSKKAEKIS